MILLTLVALAAAPQPISDVACLRKMSLDLTHRGPTKAEVDAVKAKTSTLAFRFLPPRRSTSVPALEVTFPSPSMPKADPTSVTTIKCILT